MRTRPRVLIDVDGVLANYVAAVLPIVERITGRARVHADVTDWDIAKSLGLDRAQEDALYAATREAGFCAAVPVYPGAQDGVRALRERADVYFITSPTHGRHWYFERTEWLVEHFGARVEDVGHVKHKEIVAGDVLVDDKAAHVEAWQRHHPQGVGLLWDQAYNRSEHGRRATTWAEVVAVADMLADDYRRRR